MEFINKLSKLKTSTLLRKNSFIKILFLLYLSIVPSLNLFSQTPITNWPILKSYDQEHLLNIALPLGGIGTGTVSLGGRGELRDWQIMNRPGINFSAATKGNNAPFFSIYIKPEKAASITRALIGPVHPTEYQHWEGRPVNNHGMPRFSNASFDASYPVGIVHLSDQELPVRVKIIGFNPLVPGDADASGLPVAVLTYEVTNLIDKPLQVAVCGTMRNFVGMDGSKYKAPRGDVIPEGARHNQNTYKSDNGISGIYMYSDSIDKKNAAYGTIALSTIAKNGVTYRRSSERNSWEKGTLDFWDDFSKDGELTDKEKLNDNNPMASLAVKQTIAPKATSTFRFYITWNFPNRYAWSKTIVGNYYSAKYTNAWDAAQKIIPAIPALEIKTRDFLRAFTQATIPAVVKEAALFNISTLRSQTVFRIASGELMGYEGMGDGMGSCWGSCTHVWNYDLATPYLFGQLACTMRNVEMNYATDPAGKMSFRIALPLAEASKGNGVAAADGQMGSIIKLYREWQLSGDDSLLRRNWSSLKLALAFAWVKGGWDADQDGVMEGCQHNTMDVEYFGPNPQMQFWYLGALGAAEQMALYIKDKEFADKCHQLFLLGKEWTAKNLFNGEYFIQKIKPIPNPADIHPGLRLGIGAENLANPDFQLGEGCLVDQLVGQMLAHTSGLGYLNDPQKIKTTLTSVMKYNYVKDFSSEFNNMRSFAIGKESGLVMAKWPGERLKVPFPYFAEAMTGFEYTAAIGMLYEGQTANGLKCIKAIRERYDGLKRNPYDEPECGHHYVRAMASWGVILATSGFQYSAVTKEMTFTAKNGTYFWSNGYAWGTYTINSNKAVLKVLAGEIAIKKLNLIGKCTYNLNTTKYDNTHSLVVNLK